MSLSKLRHLFLKLWTRFCKAEEATVNYNNDTVSGLMCCTHVFPWFQAEDKGKVVPVHHNIKTIPCLIRHHEVQLHAFLSSALDGSDR